MTTTTVPAAELNRVVRLVAYLNGLSDESEECAFRSAWRSPRRAWECYTAILRSHGIAMAPETEQRRPHAECR